MNNNDYVGYVKCESCQGSGLFSDSQTGETQECFDCDGGYVAVTDHLAFAKEKWRKSEYLLSPESIEKTNPLSQNFQREDNYIEAQRIREDIAPLAAIAQAEALIRIADALERIENRAGSKPEAWAIVDGLNQRIS